MDKYSNYKWVNSEVSEQQNSSTKNLAGNVSCMTGRSHFNDHLIWLLWKKKLKNEGLLKKKAKLSGILFLIVYLRCLVQPPAP